MSNAKIIQALGHLFGKQRIVFWYDAQREFRAEFEFLMLPEVEKIELANNEFGVKYRVLREQPEQKFLLYRCGPEPERLQNWLLDVQLASGTFSTDQIALWLAELDLGPAFAHVLQEHAGFFDSAKRIEALRKLLDKSDSEGLLRQKMLAVCASTEPRLDVILEALLAELAEQAERTEEKFKLLQRCGLDGFLWAQMKKAYGYDSSAPGLQDFVIALFKACYLMATAPDSQPALTAEALVFLKRWKDSRQYEQSFETLSDQAAAALGISDALHQQDFRALMALDYFELIDRKILSELVQQVAARTAAPADVTLWLRQRRQSHWFGRFKDVYGAVEAAAEFMQALDAAQLEMSSLADGIQKYAASWYRLDQRYRKFIYHLRECGEASLLEALNTLVENLYTNNYLNRLNDGWQCHVDAALAWQAEPIKLQRDFFKHWVQPFLDRKTKVCVLISDAFRYEVGEELQRLIRQEDRFEATLEPALAMLPSYTQLGMAALLPNLSLALEGGGKALVNGQSAQGSDYRRKILAAAVPAATTLLAKDLLAMNQADSRALLRDHEVVYVYHNLIDKTGDTRDTEERVFAAAEETLAELIRLVKKLANANASNMLVTADHGFIYQNRVLDESEFLDAEVAGGQIEYRNRRFVLGHGLSENPGLKTFKPQQLGLGGTLEVQIPKSIKRLRLKGAGSRFVHGGASLQEVVIPVIHINKKRQSDVSRVEVEFIGGGGKTITTGQLAVLLYQTQAATDKLQARRLRAGLFTLEGDLISDQHELSFDFESSNPRDRELPVRFILSRKADESNNSPVVLKLEERVGDTTHFREYKAMRYTIRRSFTSEFDF